MQKPLTETEKKSLLAIARQAIIATVAEEELPTLKTGSGALQEKRGCFVTIKMNNQLRGCIGTFLAEHPLCRTVQEMAVSAATRDPRFYPMKMTDLDDFTIEISVLSPLHEIQSIDEIRVGVHGIYLEKNYSRGVLLPQVATEYGWDRDSFLAQTCIKAGLRPHDWEDGATIYIFSADVFGEK